MAFPGAFLWLWHFLVSLICNIILIIVCTFHAVKTRNIPDNFNESKCIGFAVYTTCNIWLTFVLTYFGTLNSFQVNLYMYLFIYLFVCPSVSVCLSIYLSIYLSVCLSIYLCVYFYGAQNYDKIISCNHHWLDESTLDYNCWGINYLWALKQWMITFIIVMRIVNT